MTRFRGVIGLLGTEVAVATTGVIGDEPVDGVQPGTVFVATVVDGDVRTEEVLVTGSPTAACAQVAVRAGEILAVHLASLGRPPAGA